MHFCIPSDKIFMNLYIVEQREKEEKKKERLKDLCKYNILTLIY